MVIVIVVILFVCYLLYISAKSDPDNSFFNPRPTADWYDTVVFPTPEYRPPGTTGTCRDGTYTRVKIKEDACPIDKGHHGPLWQWWGD